MKNDTENATLQTHLALYGNVRMIRGFCRRCRTNALIIDGVLQCCDLPFVDEPKRVKRMTITAGIRKQPSVKEKSSLFEKFNNSCAYCERRFGSTVVYKGKERKVVVRWDHIVPYAYSQDNRDINFLPACQFCNSWKSDKIFRDMEQVRLFVNRKWEEIALIH